ncbi:hypothetical protein Tco_1297431 [Tanacetum coccineum]
MADLLQDNLALGKVDWAIKLHYELASGICPLLILRKYYNNESEQEEARKKRRKRRNVPRTPLGSPPSQLPPPPPPAGASGAPGTLGASGSSQLLPPPLPPPTSTSGSGQQQGSQAPSLNSSDDEDSGNANLPKANSRQYWWKPLPEEERPATPKPTWTIPPSNKIDVENNWATALAITYDPPAENSLLAKTRDLTTFIKWYCRQVNKTELTQADFEGQAYEVNLEGDQVRINVNQPLPLGGPPGHVTIQAEFLFNKDLEYLRYGSKGSNPALLISKMKAASYPNFGLELLMQEQLWIDDKFYIDRHDSPSRRKDVRLHMRILSVLRIKAYSRYSDFEDLNILLLQGLLDHLSGSDKRMLSTAVKLWTQNLVIRQWVKDFQLGYEFKHDYTIIEYPRAVMFLVNKNERKIILFNEIYKFSDGTLTRILETLAYRVKEFKAIERRLKTRRIYRNLKCFVGGRARDIDYRII